jgi:hypothetical protein
MNLAWTTAVGAVWQVAAPLWELPMFPLLARRAS